MDKYSTLHENFKQWFENHPLGLAKKTRERYLFIVKKMLTYLGAFDIRTLNDISHDSFVRFVHIRANHTSYAESSIIQRIAALDIFFSWAENHGWVRQNNNPVVHYRKMKIQPRCFENVFPSKDIFSDILTLEEQNKLMKGNVNSNLLSVRNYSIVLLILATGLYVEEISALRKKSVNLEEGYVLLKGDEKKERKVPIDLTICGKACVLWEKSRKIIQGEANNPLYFINQNNGKIHPNRLYEIVSKILKKNGIQKKHMGPDLLRQTAIYNLSKAGYSLEELKYMTGIKTNRHIEKYMLAS